MKFKPNLSKPPNDVTAGLPGEYASFSQVVEFQIPPASKLRDENNLPYVPREVLDDVENCFEARYLKALDDSFLKETTCIEVLEGYVSLAECFFKPVKKRLFRERAACKLSRSVSDVILSSDAGDNPLTDIAAEMENKIADAVVCLVRSPPNVLFAQRFKAPANLRKIIFRQLATRDLNERLTISYLLLRHSSPPTPLLLGNDWNSLSYRTIEEIFFRYAPTTTPMCASPGNFRSTTFSK